MSRILRAEKPQTRALFFRAITAAWGGAPPYCRSLLVLDIRANANQARQTVDFMAIGQQTGFENQWLLFDTYLDAIAQACADATIPAWEDRLGGVEVWTFDHCWVMVESLNID